MGVTIGCFSNAHYWLDPADVVVGPIVNVSARANVSAALLILLLRKNRASACVPGSITVGMPIGVYLYYLYLKGNPAAQRVPSFGVIPLPNWSAFVVGLSISSLIIITGVGYLL